ncbi:MAG: hypothetical protein VKJ06_03760 [Vampirovibrionales bacterium]|nr:hypothetical protein [Vampirovibrionales bacterium]
MSYTNNFTNYGTMNAPVVYNQAFQPTFNMQTPGAGFGTPQQAPGVFSSPLGNTINIGQLSGQLNINPSFNAQGSINFSNGENGLSAMHQFGAQNNGQAQLPTGMFFSNQYFGSQPTGNVPNSSGFPVPQAGQASQGLPMQALFNQYLQETFGGAQPQGMSPQGFPAPAGSPIPNFSGSYGPGGFGNMGAMQPPMMPPAAYPPGPQGGFESHSRCAMPPQRPPRQRQGVGVMNRLTMLMDKIEKRLSKLDKLTGNTPKLYVDRTPPTPMNEKAPVIPKAFNPSVS